MAARVWTGIGSRGAYLRRLSVVFAVELRLKIVIELYMREMSPTQFYEEFGGGSISRVTRNFERLEQHGWLPYIRSEGPGGSRRGGVEHFYRATELAFCDQEAMESGTFDARSDRHFTSTPLQLDQLGWERVIATVDALFVSLFEEQNDARLRASHSGEELIRASVILIAFEAPMPGERRTGTLDSRKDRYLTWSFLSLDKRGWEKVVAAIEAQPLFVTTEQERAKGRLAKSGEKPVRTAVVLAAFESPKDSAKAP